ncbi:MAG TPA: choice-of-anchor D domain-containing protein [Candidatus Acidoferrales bacterium]|nr:choice-of-anchor D domain-containing protein [Candidatus Acidoferrales bacterium]
MRRFFLGGTLVSLCALPFALGRVEARGGESGGAEAAPTVRTLARGFAVGGLATDSAGRVYFTANDRVYRVSSELRIAADGRALPDGAQEIVAGTGERGSLGDGGPANLAQLDLAAANGNLAADLAGDLFVADSLNDTVRRVDAESQLLSSVAGRWATGVGAAASSQGVVRPRLVAVDASGDLFIAANNILWRLDSAGAFSQIATVINPVGMAVSRDGDAIAVVLGGGEMLVLLRRLDSSHYGAAYTLPDGNENANLQARRAISVTQGSEMQEGLNTLPYKFSGLAIDAARNVFVAAPDANIIEKLDAKTLRLETIAGNRHRGYSGDGGAPLAAEFNAPGALTIDRDGNLFVADTGNLAIREITHAAAVAGVTLSPNTFTFPNEPTGGASAAEVFTLTNNSSAQVTGIAIDFTGGATPPDFTETSTCATTLDAGASCTISVVFMPQAAGERSAALHVVDSDPSSPQTAALAGFADDYELGLQSGNTDTLTVIPGGTANYNLAVVPDATFSGTVTIDCPVDLPAETTCTLAAGTSSSSSSGSSGATSLDLSVSPGTPQNFTMALVTTAKGPAGKSVAIEHQWPQFPAPAPGTAVLAAMIVGFIIWRSTTYRKGLKTLPYRGATEFLFVAIIVAYAATGCGGGGTPTLKTKSDPGTPTGTYTLNVRGLSQGASRALTVTLIVTP